MFKYTVVIHGSDNMFGTWHVEAETVEEAVKLAAKEHLGEDVDGSQYDVCAVFRGHLVNELWTIVNA
jgi:hypothetical protein